MDYTIKIVLRAIICKVGSICTSLTPNIGEVEN